MEQLNELKDAIGCGGLTLAVWDMVPNSHLLDQLLPSMGRRTGLKSGKRCQVGAIPNAETGELPALAEGATCLGHTSVGRLGDSGPKLYAHGGFSNRGWHCLEAGLWYFCCPQVVKY